MLKELQVHHREIGRLRVEGLKPNEIATRTGTKLTTVYSILRDPMCQSYMNGLMDKADQSVIDVRRTLASMNGKALKVFDHMLDLDNPVKDSDRITVARDTLDRNGYKAPERHEHVHGHLTIADIEKLRARAAEVNTDYLEVGT